MKQLCRASSYYQLRIGRTVKVATRTREAERKVRGRDARASRLRGSRPSRQSGKVLSQAQGAVFSSRRARRVPVSEPSRQSDTQALFRRAPVDQLELLPGPMRNVPRHAGPRSACGCAPRYPRILDLTQWPMAMRGRAPPPAGPQ